MGLVSPALVHRDDNEPLLSIGQVLARLKTEFPGLSPSKLRFLEDKNLVRPGRTAAGYRKFSLQDVERLRLVLAIQRDYYLPLKVIRKYLDDIDAGKDARLPGGDAPKTSILFAEQRWSREELVREAGATVLLLQDAISVSLITPAEYYDEDTLRMLTALAELQRSGIEPRHLRGVRVAAERELGLIESALLPMVRRGDVSARMKAEERAREIAGQLEVVRASFIRAALQHDTPKV